MQQVENLLKTSLAEIEKMLTTKTVVGEPIEVAGHTLIPLVAVGFGFGGGGGEGEDPRKAGAKGTGGGTGGGGGVKPVALVIIDKAGAVRVEPIRATASTVEKLGEAIARVVQTGKKPKADDTGDQTTH
ncbi:MAG: spore germination protein GerW family protein [Vicinamibacterales bacterium]